VKSKRGHRPGGGALGDAGERHRELSAIVGLLRDRLAFQALQSDEWDRPGVSTAKGDHANMKHFPAPEELEPTVEELAFVEKSRRLGGVASTAYVPQVGDVLMADDWDDTRRRFVTYRATWNGTAFVDATEVA
jgi:hypothetical protein